MPTINHQIEQVAIAAIKRNPRNARRHGRKKVELLASSILNARVFIPVVLDQDNALQAGHARLEAAISNGMKTVPAIRVEFPSEEARRAFALADNRLPELSGWCDEFLTEELEFLFEAGQLEITGFTTADLDLSVPQDAATKPEMVELPPKDMAAVSQLGDLWQIGPHRLLCGDAREALCWERLLGDERAALVFCDAPYNVRISGFVSGHGRNKHREFAMASGEMSPPEFIAFLRAIFRNCVRFSASGSIHYHCMDWRHMREILDAADGVYGEFKQLVVWDKGSGGQGAFYRSQHELVFVFKSGRGKHINNFGLGVSGRYRTNVVQYAGANTFRKGRDADLEAHSTVKPTGLVADFLLDCSNRGDLIADPCTGSGTSLLAAHRTKRRGAGIEIDPLYVDTAVERLSASSGLTPTLAGDGRTFGEIAAARLENGEA